MGRQPLKHCVYFLAMLGHIVCPATILLLIAGCAKEAQIVEEIRSIKTITIGETTDGQVRKFSGVVRAVDRTGLSFEVPGNVLRVKVDIGDVVKKGDVLAELDKEPYVLNVQKADADLVTANAKVEKQQSEYERQVRLHRTRCGGPEGGGTSGICS